MAIARIRSRTDDTTDWLAANPVLRKGEIGFDEVLKVAKIGDGVTAWDALGYLDSRGTGRLGYAENRTATLTYSTSGGAPVEGVIVSIPPTTSFVELEWGLNTGMALGGEGVNSSVLYEVTGGGAQIRGVCTKRYESNNTASAQGATHEGRCIVDPATTWRTFLLYFSHYSASASSITGYVVNGDTDYSKTYLQARAI